MNEILLQLEVNKHLEIMRQISRLLIQNDCDIHTSFTCLVGCIMNAVYEERYSPKERAAIRAFVRDLFQDTLAKIEEEDKAAGAPAPPAIKV